MSNLEEKTIAVQGNSVTLPSSFATAVAEATKQGFELDLESVDRVPRFRGRSWIHCVMVREEVEQTEEEITEESETILEEATQEESPSEEQEQVEVTEDQIPQEENEKIPPTKEELLEELGTLSKKKDLLLFAEQLNAQIPEDMVVPSQIKKALKEALEQA